LIFSFLSPGISWQAHIGGLAIGAAVAAIYAGTRRPEQRQRQIFSVLLLVAGLVAATVFQVNNYGI
jgi:membrane associated rhomboid family serine protease